MAQEVRRMSKFFVPYSGDKPAAVSINGHRLLILARERSALEDELEIMGASELRPLQTGRNREEESRTLSKLARVTHAGVVIAPGDLELKDVLKNLENQLPWLQ